MVDVVASINKMQKSIFANLIMSHHSSWSLHYQQIKDKIRAFTEVDHTDTLPLRVVNNFRSIKAFLLGPKCLNYSFKALITFTMNLGTQIPSPKLHMKYKS